MGSNYTIFIDSVQFMQTVVYGEFRVVNLKKEFCTKILYLFVKWGNVAQTKVIHFIQPINAK